MIRVRLDRPADGKQPAGVEYLVLTACGVGIVLADWDDARRVEWYRVFRQGVDAAPVEVAGPALMESDYIFIGLPSVKTVRVTIVPVNTAGDGLTSVAAEFVVP